MSDHCRRRGLGVSKRIIREVRRKLSGFDCQLALVQTMLPTGLFAKRMHCERRRKASSEQQSPLPASEVAPVAIAQPCRVQLNSDGRCGCVAITKDGIIALFLPDKSPTCARAQPGIQELSRPCCDRPIQLNTRQGQEIECSNLSLKKTSTNGLCGGVINIHVINMKEDSHISSGLSSSDGVPFPCHNGSEHCSMCDVCYNGGFSTQTNDKWTQELLDPPVALAGSDQTGKEGQTILQRVQRFLPLLHAVGIPFCSLLVAADLYFHWNGSSWCPGSGFSSVLFGPACNYHPPPV